MKILQIGKLNQLTRNNVVQWMVQSACPMHTSRTYDARSRPCTDQFKALNETITKPASHVIVDLDGVVLDSFRAVEESQEKYLLKWKKSLNKEQKVQTLGMSGEDIGELITKELELPIDGPVYANGIWQYQREYFMKNKLKKIKGVEELLCYFKSNNIPLALVANCNRKTFELKVSKHRNKGLLDWFCHIVLLDDKDVKKGIPSGDLYRVAACRFRPAPKEAHKYVVIESTINGIKAAKANGMQTVLYPDKIVPEPMYKSADVVLHDLDKFDPHLFSFPSR